MPFMSKPGNALKGIPALNQLIRIGSAAGLNDPQAIMGVGAALPIAGAAKVAPAVTRPVFQGLQRALGEELPDFTPVGGEALLNASRQPVESLKDAAVGAYLRLLGQGGR